eukprot:2530619-Pleurochrysis_carterae.AAC.2
MLHVREPLHCLPRAKTHALPHAGTHTTQERTRLTNAHDSSTEQLLAGGMPQPGAGVICVQVHASIGRSRPVAAPRLLHRVSYTLLELQSYDSSPPAGPALAAPAESPEE